MKTGLLAVYHRLPYPARVAVASARGASLNRWRYGSDTAPLVMAAAERETWTAERWQAWQAERLAEALDRASRQVPYYRDLDLCAGDRRELGRWPVLDKERVREEPQRFVGAGWDPGSMFEDHTSGTTGTPIVVWLSRPSVRFWYALFERRVRNWNGVSRQDRWGLLGGQLVVPVSQRRPPYWVWNAAARQLYLSAFHVGPQSARDYRDSLAHHRVRYLLGYPSALAALAHELEDQHLRTPPLDVVITNAEPLFDWQRGVISRVFGCPVRNTYGMSEAVVAGSECESGSLHLWPDAGVVEVLRDDANEPVGSGEVGRLVCTGLVNDGMPLVRYDTRDRGAVRWDRECPCGRQLPILDPIEGRMDDVVVMPDGRKIGRLDGMFKSDLAIREAQIVQEDYSSFRILVVPSDGFSDATASEISNALRLRLGDVDVRVDRCDSIPRTRNGKLRSVISTVGQDRGGGASPA